MSKTHKIVIHVDDIPKLKKYGCMRVGRNLIVVDKHPIKQIKIFGKHDVFKEGDIFG